MHFGQRIRQAREIRGWTQEELGEKISKSKSLVAQIEAGFRLPSSEFLDAVAFVTKFPVAFFNDVPHVEFPLSDVLFRAPKSIKRRDVLDTLHYAEHIFSIYTAVARKLKTVPCRVSEVVSSPSEAAVAVRNILGLEEDVPVKNLVRSLERAGVCVIVLPQQESREAFSVWVNDVDGRERPVIGATFDEGSFDRTRLSMAHELGHLVMHKAFLRKVRAEIEDEAFSFGAELLMPEKAMRKDIQEPVTLTSLARLKIKWGVSIAALVRRSFSLNLISQRQYHYLSHQISSLGWRTKEPQSLVAEKPRLFRKMAELAYGEPINFSALSADTHVSLQELRRILGDYEGAKDLEEPTVKSNVIRFAR